MSYVQKLLLTCLYLFFFQLITIPYTAPDGSQHYAEFPFSLSSTDADAQGPQSSFECLATERDGTG